MKERFEDLVGEVGPEERERLRRVHELLLAVRAGSRSSRPRWQRRPSPRATCSAVTAAAAATR
jgi:hypothetical protein